jgi:hypothetical protein
MTWAIHRQGRWLAASGWRAGHESAVKYETEAEAEKALAEIKAESQHGVRDAEVLVVRR